MSSTCAPLGLLPVGCGCKSASLALLAAGLAANFRKWKQPFFRLAALAVLMGYVILFSNSSEGHTYVITLIAYQFWYWSMKRGDALNLVDRIVYWATFIIVVVMPVDVLCPPGIMQIFYDWQINLWLLIYLWLRRCWTAFIRTRRHSPKSGNSSAFNRVGEELYRHPKKDAPGFPNKAVSECKRNSS